MAEVRCPMCSKLNPADAEVCRYCHARLKPVQPGSGWDASPNDPAEGDEPDWLRELRSDVPETGNMSLGQEPVVSDETSEETPDWLARIRDRARSEQPGPVNVYNTPDADSSELDWLKQFQGDAEASSSQTEGEEWLARLGEDSSYKPDESSGMEPSEEVTASYTSDQDLAAWLASLPGQPGQDMPSETAEPQTENDFADWNSFDGLTTEPAASSEDQPGADTNDWLSQISNWREPESQPEQTPQEMGFGIFSSDQEGSVPESEAAGESGELDWLRSFEASEPPEFPTQPAAEETPELGSFDPTAFEFTSPEAEQPAEAGLPDWLNSFQDSSSSAETPPLSDLESSLPEASPSEGDMPDWLRQMAERSETFSEQPAENLPAAEDTGVPEWLAGGITEAQEAEPEAPEGVLPSWLAGVEGETAQSETDQAPVEPLAGEADAAEELPAWLSGDFRAFAGEPAQQEAEPAPAENLPDWLAEVSAQSAEEEPGQLAEDLPASFQPTAGLPVEEITEEIPSAELPASEAAFTEDQPDWLQELAAVGESEPAEEQPLSSKPPFSQEEALPFVDENIPDWIKEFQSQAPAESSTPPLIPEEEPLVNKATSAQPFDVDLPEWLAEEAEAGKAETPEQVFSGMEDENIAQADLPSWVVAMRPVETVVPDEAGITETDQRVEKAGPLAGMRGVLPAEASVTDYRKPPVYSAKLRVSEKQRGHASLFESILAQETQPQPIPARRSRAPRVVLRALIALFLVILLGGLLMANIQLLPVSSLYPASITSMYDQIEALPVDAPVLLAVDFSPGFSGEMRFASTMVIDHLMAKNARLTVVSTVPTGPAMADSLLRDVQALRPDYDLANQVGNLGFLPGGTISLVEFVRSPQEAAPKTTLGENAWEQPALAGVQSIQDFAQVIILTDRAEGGRAWIEQVQPYLGDVPLMFISSAQAAPLLQPYVESRQAQGMVSGLMGGTLYGQRTGRQDANIANRYWGTYQIGVLIAFLMVLLGAVYSGLVSMIRRKGKEEE